MMVLSTSLSTPFGDWTPKVFSHSHGSLPPFDAGSRRGFLLDFACRVVRCQWLLRPPRRHLCGHHYGPQAPPHQHHYDGRQCKCSHSVCWRCLPSHFAGFPGRETHSGPVPEPPPWPPPLSIDIGTPGQLTPQSSPQLASNYLAEDVRYENNKPRPISRSTCTPALLPSITQREARRNTPGNGNPLYMGPQSASQSSFTVSLGVYT